MVSKMNEEPEQNEGKSPEERLEFARKRDQARSESQKTKQNKESEHPSAWSNACDFLGCGLGVCDLFEACGALGACA